MQMNPQKLIRLFALMAISDDYEEPKHLYRVIAQEAGICGVVVSPDGVRVALTELVESGLAKAYRLSTTEPVEEIEGAPPLDRLDEYYFWITDKGRHVLAVDRVHWPLDEENVLLPGWQPPSE
jgi:hypothetical protein